MTININLVQKKKVSVFSHWLIFLMVLLLLFVSTFCIHLYTLKSSIHSSEEKLAQIHTEMMKQEELMENNEIQSSEELIYAATWVEGQRVNISAFLTELTALLPKRGYILSFQLSNSKQLECIVQFDTQREAFYMLHDLKRAQWAKDVAMTNLHVQQNSDQESSRYEASYVLKFEPSFFLVEEEGID